MLRQILLVVEGSEDTLVSRENAWILAFMLFFCTLAQIIIDQRYMYYCQRTGFRTQCAMIAVLYRQVSATASICEGVLYAQLNEKIRTMRIRDSPPKRLGPAHRCLSSHQAPGQLTPAEKSPTL